MDPIYLAQQASVADIELLQKEAEALDHQRKKSEWVARDIALHSMFVRKKALLEEKQRVTEELKRSIKEEWEKKQLQQKPMKAVVKEVRVVILVKKCWQLI